jgi:hypothetical protein
VDELRFTPIDGSQRNSLVAPESDAFAVGRERTPRQIESFGGYGARLSPSTFIMYTREA